MGFNKSKTTDSSASLLRSVLEVKTYRVRLGCQYDLLLKFRLTDETFCRK